MEQVQSTYKEGYNYGIGVSSATGSPMGLGVTGAPTMVRDAPGGGGSFQFTRIMNSQDLETHLGISADASGGIGLFSASDRFSFAKDCKVQSSSIALLLYCTGEFGFEQIDDPTLSPGAAALVASGQQAQFQEKYGDCFVRGIATGGQFFGVVRIDISSESARTNVENSLSGSYGTFSGDVTVKLTDAMTKTNSSAKTYVWYEGGDVKTIVDTPEKLFTATTEWLNSLSANRKPYSVTLAPYIIANGPQPPNQADLQHQHDVLAHCAVLRSKTFDKRNLIDYMSDPQHAGDFDAVPNGPNLADLLAKFDQDLDIISQAASFAINNPKDALEPEEYARQKKGLANYTLTLVPANLPKLKGGESVVLPDFRPLTNESDAENLAKSKRVGIHWVSAGQTGQAWRILSQDPPPGTPANPGSTVTLVTTIQAIRFVTGAWMLKATGPLRAGVVTQAVKH